VRDGSNQRLVLLFPGALGDLCLALPALRALARRHAGASVTLAVSGRLRALAALTGVADVTVALDDAASVGLFADVPPPPWLGERPLLYAWLGRRDAETRARLRALAAHATFLAVERDEDGEHAAAAYARALGLAIEPDLLASCARIAVPPSARAAATLAGVTRPVLAVHAGAGSAHKRWPSPRVAEVAAAWSGTVLELVGPADLDLPALASARRIVDWPLPDLAALLGGVDRYLGNDSGVSHLAAAAGATGAVVFVATAAARWAPLGAGLVALGGAGAHGGPSAADVARALRADHRAP
jgi:ADP-heptose:LPS heptosyltransferase